MAKATKKAWDDVSNEATNSFVGFNQIGDYVLGTLVGKRKVKSTLPDKAGEMQNIYEIKVREASYHLLDDRKRVIEQAEEPEEGSIVSVGGRKIIDSRMEKIKLGQIVGLKFKEELPPKTKGFNPTKLVTVFAPKNEDGTVEMDEQWLSEQEAEKKDDMDF